MFDKLERQLPKIVIAPSFIAVIIFVYGFIAWTAWVSLTKSKLMPRYEIVGFYQYERLFDSPRWEVAFSNMFILDLRCFEFSDLFECVDVSYLLQDCHFI